MPEIAGAPRPQSPGCLDFDEGSRDATAERVRSHPVQDEGENWRALLLPLATAQDALARLEATVALASEPVRAGLVARLALAEAAGWLAHQGACVSETDLALRDAGLVGAWGIAGHTGRLATEMPAAVIASASSTAGPSGRSAACPAGGSLRDGAAQDATPPDDRLVSHALLLARHWRELAEPEATLADEGDPERDGLRRALATLGRGGMSDDAWRGWLALMRDDEGLPVLLRAARLARAWQEEGAAGEGRADLLSPAALFLAAACWRERRRDALPLPLWSAPPAMLHALAPRGGGGAGWTAALLAVAAEAARHAHEELRRVQAAEARGLAFAALVTARSHLPAALDVVLRLPVLNARMLAAQLGVSTRAGLALTGQLAAAGVLREVTGRGAWRAYTIAVA